MHDCQQIIADPLSHAWNTGQQLIILPQVWMTIDMIVNIPLESIKLIFQKFDGLMQGLTNEFRCVGCVSFFLSIELSVSVKTAASVFPCRYLS